MDELPKKECPCGAGGGCKNSQQLHVFGLSIARTSTATSRRSLRSTAGSSARTISDWWTNVVVALLRPVEKWHAWNVRRQYRKGRFGRGAVTTRTEPVNTVRNQNR